MYTLTIEVEVEVMAGRFKKNPINSFKMNSFLKTFLLISVCNTVLYGIRYGNTKYLLFILGIR